MEQKSNNVTKYIENYFDKKRELQNKIQKLKEKITALDSQYIEFMTPQNKEDKCKFQDDYDFDRGYLPE
jgi:prefoldin subunit 5